MKRSATILLLIILSSATIASKIIAPVHGTPLGSPTALPGTDPATNIFPKLLQATNGSIWLTWEKVVGTYGQVYLMVKNGFGWSGQIPMHNSQRRRRHLLQDTQQHVGTRVPAGWLNIGRGEVAEYSASQ